MRTGGVSLLQCSRDGCQMDTIIQLIGFIALNLLIWWGLNHWVLNDRTRADQRAWWYLSWQESDLLELHTRYRTMLANNESRANCLREMSAIEAALEMRRRLVAEGQKHVA